MWRRLQLLPQFLTGRVVCLYVRDKRTLVVDLGQTPHNRAARMIDVANQKFLVSEGFVQWQVVT